MPANVKRIFDNNLSSFTTSYSRVYNLAEIATPEAADAFLWTLYEDPDTTTLSYLPKGEPLPAPLRALEEAGYLRAEYEDHYYQRTADPHDWCRLPAKYWSSGDQPDETWPAALRKVVRDSRRHFQITFSLTAKAERAAERHLARADLAAATRGHIFEAKPGACGFSVDLRELSARLLGSYQPPAWLRRIFRWRKREERLHPRGIPENEASWVVRGTSRARAIVSFAQRTGRPAASPVQVAQLLTQAALCSGTAGGNPSVRHHVSP